MKIHLGFETYPYEARYTESSPLTATTKKGKPKSLSAAQQAYGQGKTTSEVADDLEARYSIVEKFVEMEEDYILSKVEDLAAMEVEQILTMGRPSKEGLSFKETDQIEGRFRRALSGRKFDGVLPGVPTATSLKGVSHLRQHPYAPRGSRPSFIDTGMYQRSFRVWVEKE